MKKHKPNPSKKTAYMREYRKLHADRFREYNSDYMKKYMTPERKAEAVTRAQKWYAENTEEVLKRTHDWYIAHRYGITHEQYLTMLEQQNGVCAICHEMCITGERLCIDHDHKTGEVRGLLCKKCNLGIGYLGDDVARVDSALQYLARYYK